MAGGAEREVGTPQPHDSREPRVTSIRKSITIGALVALVVGSASSLATARLTDRQADLDRQRVEIGQLESQASQQEARIAELALQAGEGAQGVDQLNAEIVALNERIFDLEAAKLSLEDQLSQYVNPAPGPTPTAALSVNWVQTYSFDRIICVTLKNTSGSDATISYFYSQFSAVDGANRVYQPRLHTPGYGVQLITPVRDGQLSAGQEMSGQLLFDFPTQSGDLTQLVWSVGFGDAPEIAVDLPALQGDYVSSDPASRC